MMVRVVQLVALGLVTLTSGPSQTTQSPPASTLHPALPSHASELWLVPAAAERAARAKAANQSLAEAVQLYQSGDYAPALAALTRVQPGEAVSDYVDYYRGLAQLRLQRLPEARKTLAALVARKPAGALALAAALAQADAAEAAGDARAAVIIYQRLAADTHLVSDEVLSRLGRAALAAGDRKTAAEAYLRVYYEFALSSAATAAASHLSALQDQIVKTGYQLDLGRGAMLFGARRYADARAAFADVRKQAGGDDRELADLRVADASVFPRVVGGLLGHHDHWRIGVAADLIRGRAPPPPFGEPACASKPSNTGTLAMCTSPASWK
jgi:hypothetical protein